MWVSKLEWKRLNLLVETLHQSCRMWAETNLELMERVSDLEFLHFNGPEPYCHREDIQKMRESHNQDFLPLAHETKVAEEIKARG